MDCGEPPPFSMGRLGFGADCGEPPPFSVGRLGFGVDCIAPPPFTGRRLRFKSPTFKLVETYGVVLRNGVSPAVSFSAKKTAPSTGAVFYIYSSTSSAASSFFFPR